MLPGNATKVFSQDLFYPKVNSGTLTLRRLLGTSMIVVGTRRIGGPTPSRIIY
jgi:hypothetical protein